ncbi:hypothetical protein VUR80DRAFT_5657 [Thermomyces stellatus]
MIEASVPGDPRSRQACEPCRRKKIKCTAEKPVCSCCRRLGQACLYRTRKSRPTTVVRTARKPSSLRDKFDLLESQVRDIYGLLQPGSSHGSDLAFQTAKYGTDCETQDGSQHRNNTGMPGPSRSVGSAFSETSTDPPPEVLNHAIDVYRTMIHLQPLPLFRLRDLSHHLASSPRFLLHSFLALTLSFRSHTAYHDRQAEVAESYARSGQDTVRKLAFQGVSTLEVIQSLCLLALRDILGNYQTPGPPSAPKPLKS